MLGQNHFAEPNQILLCSRVAHWTLLGMLLEVQLKTESELKAWAQGSIKLVDIQLLGSIIYTRRTVVSRVVRDCKTIYISEENGYEEKYTTGVIVRFTSCVIAAVAVVYSWPKSSSTAAFFSFIFVVSTTTSLSIISEILNTSAWAADHVQN